MNMESDHLTTFMFNGNKWYVLSEQHQLYNVAAYVNILSYADYVDADYIEIEPTLETLPKEDWMFVLISMDYARIEDDSDN